MLTVDDCNTILNKYSSTGFWYELDFNKMERIPNKTYIHEFFIVTYENNLQGAEVQINNTNHKGQLYFKNSSGEIIDAYVWGMYGGSIYDLDVAFNGHDDVIMCVFISTAPTDANRPYFRNHIFIPITDLVIPVINGEFDEKFYIDYIGRREPIGFHVNNEAVELEEDEKGTFLRLPSATDAMIGPIMDGGNKFQMYKVTFREFKSLPIPYIPTLYRGTPQSIQVLNTEDDDPISDYQTYYQGRQLKDNTIQLPYDSDEYVDIMVDLKDYRYPFCTLKLKAPTTLYTANSQSDVETAIENGIQTLQVGDNQTEVTLNEIALTNVTLINSNIQLTDSTLTDCQIIDTVYTDNGGNNITNTIFNSVDYTNTAQSNYNETTFNECDIHDSEINLTGTITDSTITDSLILSDGLINIQDNTFTGVGAKEYFPSHLYLTGDYTVTGNTFNLTGEWTELEYNMCIIKATNDFNPSNFIKQNNLQLNITYDSEPTNTFYYNIVDEDKIRAVRLQ